MSPNTQTHCIAFIRAAAQLSTTPDSEPNWDRFINEIENLNNVSVLVACRSLMQCFGYICFSGNDPVHKKARSKVLETFLQIAKKDAYIVWHELLKHKLLNPEKTWTAYDDGWVRRNFLEATFGLAAELNDKFDRELLDQVIAVERSSNLPGKTFVIQYLDTKADSP